MQADKIPTICTANSGVYRNLERGDTWGSGGLPPAGSRGSAPVGVRGPKPP